jgi:3-dehydroquinate synthase
MSTHILTVDLGERSYPIIIGRGLLAGGFDLAQYMPGNHCLVVTNETVGPLYLEKLQGCLTGMTSRSLALPDGESFKTSATMQTIIDELVTEKAGRDATVVALGGGVVGDIAGFASACYMRGVAFVQVPTTLLAQVDSSVGGKTGVNHEGGKNLIGAFHQPNVVLIDTDTLSTLADREFRAGLAEVIKYGAIVDKAFFSWLESNMQALLDRNPDALAYAIRRSCELKAAVVAEDERESGRRALLNFGHTFGHAIENTMGYGEWLHGEAVAAGMVLAAEMSGIDNSELRRLTALIESAGLPTRPPPAGAGRLREAMQLDKKVQANKLRFVLLHSLGDAFVTADYADEALGKVLQSADT